MRSRALLRSCPNGFSMTTRFQPWRPGCRTGPIVQAGGPRRGTGRAGSTGRTLGSRRCRAQHRARPPPPASRSNASSSENSPGDEPHAVADLLPHAVPERCPGVLADRVVSVSDEVLVAPVPAGEADQRETGRQQPAVGQVVDGRQQFLARQVAGHAEHDEHARLGDPRDAAITRIAQRVGHQDRAAPCRVELLADGLEHPVPGVGELADALVLQHGHHVVVADPELLEVREDLPSPRRRCQRSCCRRTTPWSAIARIVASGIVFTVCGAIRSSTYMVSR